MSESEKGRDRVSKSEKGRNRVSGSEKGEIDRVGARRER